MNEENTTNHWPEQSPRVIAVRPGDRYRLELTFDNGVSGAVDLEGWLVGEGGVMAPLADREFFRQVSVDEEAGTIRWPNGVDLCPDVLYSRATGIPVPFARAERPTIVR
jgi:hypothetical protein